jgi:hypothetical protein
MTEYDQRLRACAKRYSEEFQRRGGGFGEDRISGAPVSIVNTAEILTVFHAAGVPYHAPSVRRAHEYIAAKVQVHPLPRGTHHEARGRSTRYPAFGLLGLTAYAEGVHDGKLEKAQQVCVRWFDRYELDDGGWSESARVSELSLLSTQAVVEGLERLCVRIPDTSEVEVLCQRARAACLRQGVRGTGSDAQMRWWSQKAGGTEPSASATALAVMLLARGTAHQRGAAREGVEWLVRNADRWAAATEGDANSRTANWRHMTFSLALRAVLAIPGISPARPELQGVVAFLNELWNEEQDGWSHGRAGADVTPTGCYAVVRAVQALAHAYRFDPNDLLKKKPSRSRSTVSSARRKIAIDAEGRLTVIDLGDQVLVDRFALRQRASKTNEQIIRLLARRQRDHLHGAEAQGSMTTAEIASALNLQEQSVSKAITRLNANLSAATPIDDGTLVELIQPVGATRSLANRRWRIDATAFELEDRPPDTSAG